MATLQGPGLVQAMKVINTTEGSIPKNGQLLGAHADTNVRDGSFSAWRVGGTDQYIDPNTGNLTRVTPDTKIDQNTAVATLQYQASQQYYQNIYNASGGAIENASPNAQAIGVAMSYACGNCQAVQKYGELVKNGASDAELAQYVGNLKGFTDNSKTTWADQLNSNGGDSAKVAGTGTNSLIDKNIDPNAKPPTPGNAGAPGAPGAPGAGGAGCASSGMNPASLMSAAGLQNALGMATNGLTGQLTNALGAAGITGVAGDMMKGALQGGISGIMSGQGLAGFAQGALGSAMSSITGPIMQQISQLGGNILPSLTGVLPPQLAGIANGAINGAVGQLMAPLNAIMQNPMNLPNVMQQFAANGGLQGMIKNVANNMVGGAVGGGLNAMMNNLGVSNAYSGIANQMVGAASEASAAKFGTQGPGALGANFRNMNDVLSYGVTSLTRNLAGASTDMLNLGTFSTSNPTRLMQPGNVANQILNAGLGTKTGLTTKLITAGVPLAGVDDPRYDRSVQNALTQINDPAAVASVSSHFNVATPVTHLGQLTDYKTMMPNMSQTSPHNNFKELGEHFMSLGITRAENFQQVGMVLSKVDPGLDLNHVSQMSTPFYQPAIDEIQSTYGFGGGTIGEITMADFMGTCAGYVHNDTLPHIIAANDAVMATADGQELQRRLNIMHNIINGLYNVPAPDGTSASGGGTPPAGSTNVDTIVITPKVSVPWSGTPTNKLTKVVNAADVSGSLTGGLTGTLPIKNVTNPITGDVTASTQYLSNVTDADGNAVPLGSTGLPVIHDFGTTPYDGIVYTSLDACLTDFIPYVEAQLTVIKNTTDPNLQKLLAASEAAHLASCAQLLKEEHMSKTFGIDHFNTDGLDQNPTNAFVFASQLPYHGMNMGYGEMGHFLERVATDDIWGDSIKAAMRQGKNKEILSELGIDTGRFDLPRSKYYNDPYGFAQTVYNGEMPIVPDVLLDPPAPQNPDDIYIQLRNSALINSGNDPAQMLPAQADEAYYDIQWANTSEQVKKSIGMEVLGQVVSRNTLVIGDKCYVVGLNRSQNLFATIDDKGLLLTNNEMFVGTMLSLCNKILYGSIGTTKYDNPFLTDQMVYGMLEMLSQVTPSNVDALGTTLLGSQVLAPLLDKIRNQFQAILKTMKTGMDRNETTGWGGSGPDGQFDVSPRNS